MVWVRCAEDVHDAGQCGVGAGAHVQRFDGQPHRVHADHRSSSRIPAAQSAAAAIGQVTLIVVVPRRSSIRMSAAAAGEYANGNAMNSAPARIGCAHRQSA